VTLVDFLLYFACPEGQAAVNQYIRDAPALVPLFHVADISVKAFPMLITDGAKVFKEKPSLSPKNVFLGTHFIP